MNLGNALQSVCNAMRSLGALTGEMRHLPFRRRSSGPAEIEQLTVLLDPGAVARTGEPGSQVGSDWQAASEVLRAAAAPAHASELTGELAIVAAFRRQQLGAPSRRRRPQMRPNMFSALLTGKLAALAIGTTVGIGGATTAAYANVLPAPIQNFAHATIGAPAPQPHTPDAAHLDATASAEPVASPTATESPQTHKAEPKTEPKTEPKHSEPAKTKPAVAAVATASEHAPDPRAAYGLCRAHTEATQHGLHLVGSLQEKLVKLAGGADKITAYCAAVSKPSPNRSETHRSEAPNAQITIELCAAFGRGVQLPEQYLGKLAALAGGTDKITSFCATVPKPSGAPHVSPTPTAVIPHLSDTQWAIGLCNAFGHGVHLTGDYLAKLTALAGGADNITSFCATVPSPSPNPAEHSSSAPTTPATTA